MSWGGALRTPHELQEASAISRFGGDVSGVVVGRSLLLGGFSSILRAIALLSHIQDWGVGEPGKRDT